MLYRGRFAPSPTGPLHFGSLVAAVSSYLEARVHNGEWLVRIEDLDPPREVPGAAQGILRSLERFGFAWNDEVLCQSTRTDAYMEALAKLGTVYRKAFGKRPSLYRSSAGWSVRKPSAWENFLLAVLERVLPPEDLPTITALGARWRRLPKYKA